MLGLIHPEDGDRHDVTSQKNWLFTNSPVRSSQITVNIFLLNMAFYFLLIVYKWRAVSRRSLRGE